MAVLVCTFKCKTNAVTGFKVNKRHPNVTTKYMNEKLEINSMSINVIYDAKSDKWK